MVKTPVVAVPKSEFVELQQLEFQVPTKTSESGRGLRSLKPTVTAPRIVVLFAATATETVFV